MIVESFVKNNRLPIVFKTLPPGFDLHYGSNIPMLTGIKRIAHSIFVDKNCELNIGKNIFVLDGSILPKIPAKPATLYLMGNSIRVAKKILNEVS